MSALVQRRFGLNAILVLSCGIERKGVIKENPHRSVRMGCKIPSESGNRGNVRIDDRNTTEKDALLNLDQKSSKDIISYQSGHTFHSSSFHIKGFLYILDCKSL